MHGNPNIKLENKFKGYPITRHEGKDGECCYFNLNPRKGVGG